MTAAMWGYGPGSLVLWNGSRVCWFRLDALASTSPTVRDGCCHMSKSAYTKKDTVLNDARPDASTDHSAQKVRMLQSGCVVPSLSTKCTLVASARIIWNLWPTPVHKRVVPDKWCSHSRPALASCRTHVCLFPSLYSTFDMAALSKVQIFSRLSLTN